jgi:hypothetical protein
MFLTILGAVRAIGPEAVPPTPWMTEVRAAYPRLTGG